MLRESIIGQMNENLNGEFRFGHVTVDTELYQQYRPAAACRILYVITSDC